MTAFAADLGISEILFLSSGKIFSLWDFRDLIFVLWGKNLFSKKNSFIKSNVSYRDKIIKEEIATFSKTKGPSGQEIIWGTYYYFYEIRLIKNKININKIRL